jgi:2-polyprenyl-6-hydroxyphenyl methylase/3-demethylubiquinone-9 3-methyltransferase
MTRSSPLRLPEADDRFAGTEPFLTWQVAEDELYAKVDTVLRRISKLEPVEPGMSLLEIGVGSGWFSVFCAERGLRCTGIEHNPHYCEHALRLAADRGVELEMLSASIEDVVLPVESFDIAVAASVFEHVRDHERALGNIFAALRPGGVLYFSSTNKFAPRSGEYPLLLYGWMPYGLRRRLRIAKQGPRIVETGGVDFHQFTYLGLRRLFRRIGFSRSVSLLELLDPEDLNWPSAAKLAAIRATAVAPPVRHAVEFFASGTYFFCVK